MIATLQFDLEKSEDATGYARALNAETYVLALYDIKKRLSDVSTRATKAELIAILGEIYTTISSAAI